MKRAPPRKAKKPASTRPDPLRSAEFLGALFDCISSPVFVKDRRGRYVLCNQAFCDLVGRPMEEIRNKTDLQLFLPEEASGYRQRDSLVLGKGVPFTMGAERFTDARGNVHLVQSTKVPLETPGQALTHVVGTIHDITEMSAAREALHRANEELDRRVQQRTAELAAAQAELMRKERLAVLGQLAGGLAHQIRNPLGAIVNAAALLKHAVGAQPSAAAQSALSTLDEEAWRANRIITDLIDYARVRQSVPLRTEVRELLEQALRVNDVGAHIKVQRRLPTQPLFVSVDPEQVLGALGNLVSNAVEAMPSGGTLSLGARTVDGVARLTIRDTGSGIADAIRPYLFQPLVTSKAWGLGLGLPTARALVENQGGTLECVKTDPSGTQFELTLPLAEV